MPSTTRTSLFPVAALSLAALVMGCAESPEPRAMTSAATAAYDGRWLGQFDSAPGSAADGISCTAAPAEFDTARGALGGTVNTRFGDMAAVGGVSPGGQIQGRLTDASGGASGSFAGRMTDANIMSGQYSIRGCTGMFTLRRL